MKKKYLFIFLLAISLQSTAQDFGLSFSYFVPRNGEFSTPISPFSIRGIGLNLGKMLAVETGASLYRMAGLNLTGTPFFSTKPMAGNNVTLFIPAEVVFRLKGKGGEFNINGGGFAYHSFFQRLNEGNIDRAIRDYEGWTVANSDFSLKTKPGVGWKAGAELIVDVTRQWGLSFEVNYLAGSSALPLEGTYKGVDETGQLIERMGNFSNAKLDFTGLEFSLSILMKGR